MTAKPRVPRVVSPGAALKRELEARGWTQQDLAGITGRPPQLVSEIVTGAKRITAETALHLARAFGTPAELWLDLDARYQLRKAEEEESRLEAERIRRRARLYSIVPVQELVKRRWIRDGRTLEELESEVCRFLGIRHLAEDPRLAARLRQLEARPSEAAACLAWAKRIEETARFRHGRRFEPDRLRRELPALLELATAPELASRALELLLGLGIGIALVRPLPRSSVVGVAFVGDRPVIGLGLRRDRLDHFWFTLLRGLAHLFEGREGVHVDTFGPDGAGTSVEEQPAILLAQEWLIPGRELTRFLTENRPTRRAILEFSGQIGRHPAIVVGQLQSRKVLKHASFRELLPGVVEHLGDWMSP